RQHQCRRHSDPVIQGARPWNAVESEAQAWLGLEARQCAGRGLRRLGVRVGLAAGLAAIHIALREYHVLRPMSFLDKPRRSTTRRWLFQIHLWLGLIVGPVVGIVALTGAIVVFRYELNRLTTPGTAYVTPQAKRLTIDELFERVQAARPGDRINQAGWGEAGPDTAWNFRSSSPAGHRIHTYIDQYTGTISGRDDYQNKFMQ